MDQPLNKGGEAGNGILVCRQTLSSRLPRHSQRAEGTEERVGRILLPIPHLHNLVVLQAAPVGPVPTSTCPY